MYIVVVYKQRQFVMGLKLSFAVPQSSQKGDKRRTPGNFTQQLHTYELGDELDGLRV